MGNVEKLLKLFDSDSCDYDMCRQIIDEIGGSTQIIEGKYGVKTTPLHEAVEYGHYDFATEHIKEPGANLDVDPNDSGPLIWELQYLYAETQEERMVESKNKLKLMRALISSGANPNPKEPYCGQELLYWIRDKLNEGEGDYHIYQMDHIIEAHAYGETERFFEKSRGKAVSRILLSDFAFLLIDDNLCDSDHAIFEFEDGERMVLSSYQIGDDEWDFYSVPLDDETEYGIKYNIVKPNRGCIKYFSLNSNGEASNSHWLDLLIDDAILRIHADELNFTVGIVGFVENDYHYSKRKKLFENED